MAIVLTSFAGLVNVTGPVAVIANNGVISGPVWVTAPLEIIVKLVDAVAPSRTVAPVSSVTATVVPFNCKLPKELPVLLRVIRPLPPTELASALKLAMPAMEIVVPNAWVIPVCTSLPTVIAGAIVVTPI